MTTKQAGMSDADVLSRFLKSDEAAALREQYADEQADRRRALVAELAALNADHLANITELKATADAAQENVRAHEDVLRGVKERAQQAAVAVHVASTQHDAARGRLVRELRATAATEIDDFLAELAVMAEDTRAGGFKTWRGKPTIEGKRPVVNNHDGVMARLKAIVEARPEVEALKLEALTPAELTVRLGGIRTRIPAAGDPVVPRHLRHLFDEPETADKE